MTTASFSMRPYALRAAACGAVALLITSLGTAASSSAASTGRTALAGTWAADLSHSAFKGRAPYRNGKMVFTPEAGNTVHVVADVTTANGAMFHFEYSGPEDGTELPVSGNPYYNSAKLLWKDAHTLERTELRAGQTIGTTTMVLANDGKSFTASSSRSTPEDGHLYTSTIVWKRVSD